jgi:hypothetical protein
VNGFDPLIHCNKRMLFGEPGFDIEIPVENKIAAG